MARKTIYVWTYPPGSKDPVLAGAMVPVVDDVTGVTSALFRYDPKYVARPSAVALDPENLPLPELGRSPTYETKKGFEMFGVIRDAAPDAWGQVRMDRKAGRTLNAIEYVLASGEDRFGFLAFSTSKDSPAIESPWRDENFRKSSYLDLGTSRLLLKEVDSVQLTPEENGRLLLYGSSLGGARPKASVIYDERLWIAKPSRMDDQRDLVRAEYAAMSLLKQLGITVPQITTTIVDGRPIYMIERFDREFANGKVVSRFPAISVLSLMDLPENTMTWRQFASYEYVSRIVKKHSASPEEDRRELFRRMVANVLLANSDDHPKNHAMYWRPGHGWRLSPVYDVVPMALEGRTRYLAMNVLDGDRGEVTLGKVLQSADAFGLSLEEGRQEVAKLAGIIKSKWRSVFTEAGVPAREIEEYAETLKIIDDWEVELEAGGNDFPSFQSPQSALPNPIGARENIREKRESPSSDDFCVPPGCSKPGALRVRFCAKHRRY